MPAPKALSTRGLGFLIADINRLMRKEFDRRVLPLGLTRAQWMFIAYLDRQPGCTQSELADRLQLHKITVSRQADRLVSSGWIERRDCAADGRAYGLFLAAKAVRLRARMEEAAAGLREDFLRGLTSPRRAALIKSLTLIQARLQRMDAGATTTP